MTPGELRRDEAFLEAAVAAAREAGALLLDHFRRGVSVDLKGAVDLVTEADRAAEALVVARLRAALPEASILAEEGGGFDGRGDLRWVVDPLDGTTNFAHGYGVFAVSIALEREEASVLGVVLDPVREECFTARRGGGAHLNGRPIAVSGRARLEEALLATGFPYDIREHPRNNLPQFAAFARRARGVRRDGSAALDLCAVAAGRFDGFWEEKLAPWDVAAGMLIVAEAGGAVSGYRGEPADAFAGNLVASNGRIHGEMVGVLESIERSGELPPLTRRYSRGRV